MSPLMAMAVIFLAGGLGGLANAFLKGDGVAMPHWQQGIWCPGFVGNAFVGSLAALVSWGLYGAGSGVELTFAAAPPPRPQVSLTIGACAGAVLVGVGGARWLSSEVDKQFLRQAAVEAGTRQLSPEDCQQIQRSPPMKVLNITRRCPPKGG